MRAALPLLLVCAALLFARTPLASLRTSLDGGARAHIEGEVFPRELHDDVLDAAFTLPRPPERIVSLTLASDVLLARLVPVERVVGVTSLVDDASYSSATGHYAASVPRVRANAEALLALQPDLVIVAPYSSPETVRVLVSAGVPVLRLFEVNALADVEASAQLLSRAVGAEQAFIALQDELHAAEAANAHLPAQATHPRVLFLSADGYTHGEGTLIDDMLRAAGAINVAAELHLHGHQHAPLEAIIEAAPEVILLPASSDAEAVSTLDMAMPLLRSALPHARIVSLPSRALETTTIEALQAIPRLQSALSP
jgi:iron complex transport system substrate-binding protein